jgi:seryl-tRNA synthetase
MQSYNDNLFATVAYFTKDPLFYKKVMNTFILPENIQSDSFINNIEDLIENKLAFIDKMDKVDKLQDQVNLLQTELKNKQNEENKLQKQIIELSQQIVYKDIVILEQIKDLKEDKIKTDAQIKDVREENDSQIKALKDEKDSQIKALKDEKDSQIKSLRDEKDSQIKALRDEKDAQIKALREEKIQIEFHIKDLKEKKTKQIIN